MGWYALTVEVMEGQGDDIAALLLDAGATGAEVRDRSVAAMPGAAVPPPGRACVVAFFADRAAAEGAAYRAGLDGTIADVPPQDWSESWKLGLTAFAVGRIFIRPSWIDATPPPGTIEVVLDPGMAFGTGTHPTTELCLRALDTLLARHPGSDVLDVGTGSGLLAIAALKLGGGRVVATENDPDALRVAEENADRNGTCIELRLAQHDAVTGSFSVVVANILANTLVELAPWIVERLAPGGTVVLSGILGGQEEEVRAAYLARGLARCPDLEAAQGEWRLLALQRAAANGETGGAGASR